MDATGYDATMCIPDKGSTWNWSTAVTHRVDNRQSNIGVTTDRLGIDIQAEANAKINYSGDDFMLTIKKAFGKVNIEGSWWTYSGDAKGWLRVKNVAVTRSGMHPAP